MASFGNSFKFGSAVSATGSAFSEAFESYRRAQYLVAGSNVVTSSEASDLEDGDEESGHFRRRTVIPESEDEDDDYFVQSRRRQREDSFVDQFNWDEDHDAITPRVQDEEVPYYISTSPRRPQRVEELAAQETTPLIGRKPSSIHERLSIQEPVKIYGLQEPNHLAPPPLLHKSSTISRKSVKSIQPVFSGRSTYGQTLFNSIAILLGIGMLSEPLAFAYSGWFVGTLLIIGLAYVSCYTAKILAGMILADPRLRSYSDIGRKAFGPRATIFISIMFCLELFAVSVILVTLYADSLHAIIPTYSANTYKVWGILLLIPTVFLPLSLLSYTSILGIFSTIVLVFVIFIDGFSKVQAPGSLWDPMPTEFGVKDFSKVGVAFGLFMAGFSGHAVIPSLARDMIDPTQFDHMIDRAFLVATCIYAAIGAAGYLMFGENVHDEISVDLLRTPGYAPTLNQICLWLLVISPLSKFALNTQPLNTTIEVLLGIDANFSSPEDLAERPDGMKFAPHGSHIAVKKMLGVIQRVIVTILAVAVSIWVPEFSALMAFLGSFSAFMLAIVGPILAKVTVERRCSLLDGTLMFCGIAMALWGTLASILSS